MASQEAPTPLNNLRHDKANHLQHFTAHERPGVESGGAIPPSGSSPDERRDLAENPTVSGLRSFPKEWRTWKLRPWWMAILLFTETALIVAIIVLGRISASHNGIASILQISFYSNSHSLVADIWRHGLLWITLPSFVMAIYAALWTNSSLWDIRSTTFCGITTAAESRCLCDGYYYVGLQIYPALYSWWVALFKKFHVLIGVAMFLSNYYPLQSFLYRHTCSWPRRQN